MKHQWWCGGIDPCACTEMWKEQQAKMEAREIVEQIQQHAGTRHDRIVMVHPGTGEVDCEGCGRVIGEHEHSIRLNPLMFICLDCVLWMFSRIINDQH